MGFDIDALFKKEEFQKLTPERIAAFKTLAAQLEGKSGPEAVGILMQFNKNMPQGPPLEKEDQDAMIKILLESLPPQDKQKFQAVLKMLEMMKI